MNWLLGAVSGIIVVAFAAGFALAGAWPVMIALGILHTYWHGVPAFGFLATWVLLWATAVVASRIFPSREAAKASA